MFMADYRGEIGDWCELILVSTLLNLKMLFKRLSVNIYNSLQNILRKFKKSSKVRQDGKILISVLAYFFSASARNLFPQGGSGKEPCFHKV